MSRARGVLARSARTFQEAMGLLANDNFDSRIILPDKVNTQIMKKLNLRNQYPSAESSLNIIDFNASYNNFTYKLNQDLHPRCHTLVPESPNDTLFWNHMLSIDPSCASFHMLDTQGKAMKHQDLEVLFQNGVLTPQTQQDLTKVNDTLLIHANFMAKRTRSYFRSLLYFNQIRVSWFVYNNVKMLAWLNPQDALKYIGPMGTRYRQTNSVVANMFADVKVVAYSTYSQTNEVRKHYANFTDALVLPEIPKQDDLCLLEIQSNYNKHHVEYQDELTLVVHKLFILPAKKLREAAKLLGPGADEYFPQVLPEEMCEKKINELSESDFLQICEQYYLWPFKPNLEMEMYSDAGGSNSAE